MRVTIVNQHFNDVIGGSELQSDIIATGLSDMGCDVVYIAPGGSNNIYNTNYTVIIVDKNAVQIAQAVISSNPDIVYWRYNKHFFYRAIKKIRKFNIPVIFAASHANDLEPYGVKPGKNIKGYIYHCFLSRFNHEGFKHVQMLTVNNRYHLDRVSIPSRQKYIPNGVITDKVKFNWPRPYCAWVSNVKPAKRPEKFVELAKELEDSGVDFLMAGDIQSIKYNWLLEKEYLPRNLYYLGPMKLKEVNGLFSSSLFHIHTCCPEGFSNVFLQAWAQGKPSVSLSEDPSGYINSMELGFNARDDWKSFVDKICFLLNDTEERKKLGLNAKRLVNSKFTTKQLINSVYSLMKLLVEENQLQSLRKTNFIK